MLAGVIGIGELWAGGQLGATSTEQIEMAQMLVKTARQVETLAHDRVIVHNQHTYGHHSPSSFHVSGTVRRTVVP